MSATYDYGPLSTYEIIWNSGHVEQIKAHQVLLPPMPSLFFAEQSKARSNRLTIHGEIDGRWKLILDADYSEIASVRLLDEAEVAS